MIKVLISLLLVVTLPPTIVFCALWLDWKFLAPQRAKRAEAELRKYTAAHIEQLKADVLRRIQTEKQNISNPPTGTMTK